jgi:hypothetical protein
MFAAVLVGAAIVVTPAVPAQAATSDCSATDDTPSAENTLTVTQTSVMDGLAPDTEPRAITGDVVNHSPDSTYITAVSVQIVSVTPSPGAPQGRCDPSDYEILDPVMPVGRWLTPGGSTTFRGAAIGMTNKPVNQDACKSAVIHLLYTANPR